MSQNELAGICEVEPITVGRLIDRLEARGMVERRSDPNDRRIRRLHLLPAADPILTEIAKYREALDLEVRDGLDDASLDALVDALLHIKSKLTAESASPAVAAAGE
jgi:DNA-binding MarR family transcriptional regulator